MVVMRQRARKVSATHWVFEPPEDVPTAEEAYAVAWSDGLSLWLERWAGVEASPVALRESEDCEIARMMRYVHVEGAPVARA
jgi:hypothetical protein